MTTRSSSISGRSSTSAVCDRSTRARDPARDRGGQGRREELQHAHDRDSGAEDGGASGADGRTATSGSTRMRRGPKIRILRGDGTVDVERAAGAGVAARKSADQRGRHPDGPARTTGTPSDPKDDSQFESRYTSPELAGLINGLYPALGTNPASAVPTTGRGDLVAVLLTGVPTLNITGSTQADLLRLNTQLHRAAGRNGKSARTARRRVLGLPERTPSRGRRNGYRDPRDRLRIRHRRRSDHRAASGSATATPTALRTTCSRTEWTRTRTTDSCPRSPTSRRRIRATRTQGTSRNG